MARKYYGSFLSIENIEYRVELWDGATGSSANNFASRYATPVENSGDKFEHGTVFRGEQIARAKLTEECVREIRRLYQTGGFSQQDIADRFGVVQSAVSAVLIGKTWAHVE